MYGMDDALWFAILGVRDSCTLVLEVTSTIGTLKHQCTLDGPLCALGVQPLTQSARENFTRPRNFRGEWEIHFAR